MLTPAIKASSTSEPRVIREKAFSTQVASPPFLNTLPLAEEMTTGRMPRGAITVGAWPDWLDWPVNARGTAAARPAVAPAMMKSRRFRVSVMTPPFGFPALDSQRWHPARATRAGPFDRSGNRGPILAQDLSLATMPPVERE